MDRQTEALVLYFGGACGRHALVGDVCAKSLKKDGFDPTTKFWEAASLVAQGSVTEGIRELRGLEKERGLGLCVAHGLAHASSLGAVHDEDAVAEYEGQIAALSSTEDEDTLCNGAAYLWFLGKADQARRLAQRAMRAHPGSASAATLRGWIDLTSGRSSFASNSGKFFDAALDGDMRGDNVLALLGRAVLERRAGRHTDALDTITQITVAHNWFLPAQIERVHVLIALGDWDQVVEACSYLAAKRAGVQDAMLFEVVYNLVRVGQYNAALARFQELASLVAQMEPGNATLYVHLATVVSRLCGRDTAIIEVTTSLVQQAIDLDPTNAAFHTELGNEQFIGGQMREAMASFRQAMHYDDGSVAALQGTIKCQIYLGEYSEASRQLAFLNEINSSMDQDAELVYLNALVAWRQRSEFDQAIALLEEAARVHLATSVGDDSVASIELFTRFNPDFVQELAREMLQHAGTEPREYTEASPPLVQTVTTLLTPLVRFTPGSVEGLLMLAQVKYIDADFERATSVLNECLAMEPSFSEAHILLAKVYLEQGKHQLASQALDQALSYNFKVRESPSYHLVEAAIFDLNDQLQEAVETLDAAMQLPGVRAITPGVALVPESERVTVFVETSLAKARVGQMHEATKLMQDALNEFRDTAEESRVHLGNAQLALFREDIDGALAALARASPNKPHYTKVQTMVAGIHLTHRNDRRAYTQTFKRLAEANPCVHTYVTLGDAYMNIQEPERAIAVYDSALKLDPSDASLALKIGQALIKTHDYTKAAEYFESAAQSNTSSLDYALAELHTKLGDFDAAERVLVRALDRPTTSQAADAGIQRSIADVQLLLLLAGVKAKKEEDEAALRALQDAYDKQDRIIAHVQSNQPDLTSHQTMVMATICLETARHYLQAGETQAAARFYADALERNPHHEESLIESARLHLQQGDYDACQKMCVALLHIEASHEEASIMLADIMFRKQEYDQAIYHFQEILEVHPEHYPALVRLLVLLHHAGRMESAPPFLQLAGSAGRAVQMNAGYQFAMGLYHRFINDVSTAMDHFNLARQSREWKTLAVFQMVEISLNPDNRLIGSISQRGQGSLDNPQGAQTASKLLAELSARPKPVRHLVLEQWCQIATGNKSNIAQAASALKGIVGRHPNSARAIVALATALMLQKDVDKAERLLDGLLQISYNDKEGDAFETGYMLLADIRISTSDYDSAVEILDRALAANRSLSLAWELMGVVMENRRVFADAAACYQHAWRLCEQSRPDIGFKLAVNLLKCQDAVSAIDVCHILLHKFPSYPDVRERILTPARKLLKP